MGTRQQLSTFAKRMAPHDQRTPTLLDLMGIGIGISNELALAPPQAP
jgi:hypothetical protein